MSRFSARSGREKISSDYLSSSGSSLPKGASERVEFPVDGMQVWVTRTVRKGGKVIHKETYYSNYARITGITLVGR